MNVMNEQIWMDHHVERMLTFLGDTASQRKLRLFVVACARRVLPADPDAAMQDALAMAERFADGNASARDLARSRNALKPDHTARVSRWGVLYSDHIRSVPAWHANRENAVRAAREGANVCAWSAMRLVSKSIAVIYSIEEFERQAAFLRDIFGNPFRPVAFALGWRTASAVALADAMYQSRDFGPMPVLADALEDAGCADADILAHCRGDGPHVRGCWVVDLVLGKS